MVLRRVLESKFGYFNQKNMMYIEVNGVMISLMAEVYISILRQVCLLRGTLKMATQTQVEMSK